MDKKSAHTGTYKIIGNSTSAQRLRLLAALEEAGSIGITTIEAREVLDIMAPAPRIFELRHQYNLNIVTLNSTEANAQGREHRVGRYVLLPGEWEAESC